MNRIRAWAAAQSGGGAVAFSGAQVVTYVLMVLSLVVVVIQTVEFMLANAAQIVTPASLTPATVATWLVGLTLFVLAVAGIYGRSGAVLSSAPPGSGCNAYFFLRQLGATLLTFSLLTFAGGFTAPTLTQLVGYCLGALSFAASVYAILASDLEGDACGAQKGTWERWLSSIVSAALLVVSLAWALLSWRLRLSASSGAWSFVIGAGVMTVLAVCWCAYKVRRYPAVGNRTSASSGRR